MERVCALQIDAIERLFAMKIRLAYEAVKPKQPEAIVLVYRSQSWEHDWNGSHGSRDWWEYNGKVLAFNPSPPTEKPFLHEEWQSDGGFSTIQAFGTTQNKKIGWTWRQLPSELKARLMRFGGYITESRLLRDEHLDDNRITSVMS